MPLAKGDVGSIRASKVGKKVLMGQETLTILHDIEFSVTPSETVAIVGASGSGKSTLLSLLAGLDSPSMGQIWLNGHCITDLDEEGRARLRAGQVGFIFQSFHLLPGLTALENVMLPIELSGQHQAQEAATSWLAQVGLGSRLHHYPTQLSGGEQQRVAIARAFAAKPSVLFADEPTGNLDRTTGAVISDLLFQLNQAQGTTLVVVTHDERLAERCQSRWNMDAGQLSRGV